MSEMNITNDDADEDREPLAFLKPESSARPAGYGEELPALRQAADMAGLSSEFAQLEADAAEVNAARIFLRERGRLLTKISEKNAEIERLRFLYNELLYAVAMKHPGETRHKTALRYIQQAESNDNDSKPHAGG